MLHTFSALYAPGARALPEIPGKATPNVGARDGEAVHLAFQRGSARALPPWLAGVPDGPRRAQWVAELLAALNTLRYQTGSRYAEIVSRSTLADAGRLHLPSLRPLQAPPLADDTLFEVAVRPALCDPQRESMLAAELLEFLQSRMQAGTPMLVIGELSSTEPHAGVQRLPKRPDAMVRAQRLPVWRPEGEMAPQSVRFGNRLRAVGGRLLIDESPCRRFIVPVREYLGAELDAHGRRGVVYALGADKVVKIFRPADLTRCPGDFLDLPPSPQAWADAREEKNLITRFIRDEGVGFLPVLGPIEVDGHPGLVMDRLAWSSKAFERRVTAAGVTLAGPEVEHLNAWTLRSIRRRWVELDRSGIFPYDPQFLLDEIGRVWLSDPGRPMRYPEDERLRLRWFESVFGPFVRAARAQMAFSSSGRVHPRGWLSMADTRSPAQLEGEGGWAVDTATHANRALALAEFVHRPWPGDLPVGGWLYWVEPATKRHASTAGNAPLPWSAVRQSRPIDPYGYFTGLTRRHGGWH